MKHQWKDLGITLDSNPPIYAKCTICGIYRDEPDYTDGKFLPGRNNTYEECPGEKK